MIQHLIYPLYFMLISHLFPFLHWNVRAFFIVRKIWTVSRIFMYSIALKKSFRPIWFGCYAHTYGKNSVSNWKFMRKFASSNFVSLAFCLPVTTFLPSSSVVLTYFFLKKSNKLARGEIDCYKENSHCGSSRKSIYYKISIILLRCLSIFQRPTHRLMCLGVQRFFFNFPVAFFFLILSGE